MKSIGIRVTPSTVYFSIIESQDNNSFAILTVDKIIVPKALKEPQQLSFLRNTLISIINEYNVINAGVRLTEPNAQQINFFRINIEGVIQELFANSSIEKYFCGAISKIASLLEENRTDISKYFDGEEDFAEIDDWGNYKREERESIVTAVAALSL